MKPEDICKSLDQPVSACNVANMLKKSGHSHWKARKRPQLNENITKLRYQWVFSSKDWAYE